MTEQTPYHHRKYGRIVISDGLSDGKQFGSFYVKPSGSLKRMISIPMTDSINEAKYRLMQWAENHKQDITTR